MAERQFVKSPSQKRDFFHWDRKGYEVDVVRFASDYADQSAILIPDVASKADERAWLAALPKMHALREIHFPYNPLLDGIALLPQLEHLNLEISKIKSLAPLSGHKSIRSLNLLHSKSLADPEVIAEWPNIECLALSNMTALHDLEWLRPLERLKHLSLDGSMFTKQILKSLVPLKSLPNLQWFEMISAKVEDEDSLFVFAEMPQVKKLGTAYYWPKGHLTKLSEMRPDLVINGDKYPNVEEVRKR